MAGDHMQVLSAQIYNEQNIVTYRLLSRLLGVQVNLAKKMLNEFYEQEKLEGRSCHATYVLSGLIEEQKPDDAMQIDTDDFPMSSPPVATQESSKSSGQSKMVKTILLVDENELDDAKSKFAELTSLHVYSLSPAIVKDPILLTTCSYDISKSYDRNLSPQEIAQKYGVIANPNAVKRQLTKYVPPAVVVGTAASKGKATVAASKPAPKPAPKPAQPPPDTKPTAHTEPEKSTTTMKRSTSGSIMSAFANAPPKGSKPKPKPVEEEAPPAKTASPPPVARVSEKRQKELDAINRLMEEDDEPQELEDFPPDEAPAAVQEESQDTAVSAESPFVATPPSQDPKRKRGKRKVLKKTTKRDEKGYLVTKNEYVYESYSEDEEEEEVEKVPKKSVPQAPAKTEGDKKKGKGAAAGQKSLMSFFGKK